MGPGWIVILEAIVVVGGFYAFCWHQFRFLKRDKAARDAKKQQQE